MAAADVLLVSWDGEVLEGVGRRHAASRGSPAPATSSLTADLGRKVAAALEAAAGCFRVNHGIVTAGTDVPTAVLAADLLDRACQHN